MASSQFSATFSSSSHQRYQNITLPSGKHVQSTSTFSFLCIFFSLIVLFGMLSRHSTRRIILSYLSRDYLSYTNISDMANLFSPCNIVFETIIGVFCLIHQPPSSVSCFGSRSLLFRPI